MGKWNKFKDVLTLGSGIAKPFVPSGVGKVLDVVTGTLNNHPEPASGASSDALRALAEDNDEQTQAILALHTRVKALEDKVQ